MFFCEDVGRDIDFCPHDRWCIDLNCNIVGPCASCHSEDVLAWTLEQHACSAGNRIDDIAAVLRPTGLTPCDGDIVSDCVTGCAQQLGPVSKSHGLIESGVDHS